MRTEFQNRFSDHEERFEDLESRTKGLDKDMKQIYLDQERMYIAINKLNLILLGLSDQHGEHPDQLFEKVRDELKVSHQDAVCDIKKVFRVGKFKTDQTRPVKIIFGDINARDAIYDGRKNLEKPLNLNEDLPFTVRMDHKKLLKIRYDAITGNPQELVLLHLHKRQIIIGKTLIKIIHGNRTEETLTPAQIQQYQPPKRDRIRTENPEGQRPHETYSSALQTTRHLFHSNTGRSEATSHTAVPGSSTTDAVRPSFLDSQRNQQPSSSRKSCTKSCYNLLPYHGYKFFRADALSNKGGILIIVREHFKVLDIDISHLNNPCNIETLTIKCQINFNKSFIVSCLYRHPVYQKATLDLDYEYFEKLLVYLNETNLKFFLMGDFNLREKYVDKLQRIITSLNMVQLVDEPTRGNHILDLVICKKQYENPTCIVAEAHLADHKLVYFQTPLKETKKETITVKVRNFKKLTKETVSKFFEVPYEYSDPDSHVDDIESRIKRMFNDLAPIQTKTFTKRDKCIYMSEETKRMKEEREHAEIVSKRYPSSVNTNAYNTLRKAVKKQIILDTAVETERNIEQHGFWKGIRCMNNEKRSMRTLA
ncbi:unnamed protein product [Orchesella dallaii]|uniref:Endonuclease/exonuclease/phosphatase domain-containing protein n=1 Tax=Orchesella dallaii TaxID=48710 RepID=A0ABP1QSM9_9HEXA